MLIFYGESDWYNSLWRLDGNCTINSLDNLIIFFRILLNTNSNRSF